MALHVAAPAQPHNLQRFVVVLVVTVSGESGCAAVLAGKPLQPASLQSVGDLTTSALMIAARPDMAVLRDPGAGASEPFFSRSNVPLWALRGSDPSPRSRAGAGTHDLRMHSVPAASDVLAATLVAHGRAILLPLRQTTTPLRAEPAFPSPHVTRSHAYTGTACGTRGVNQNSRRPVASGCTTGASLRAKEPFTSQDVGYERAELLAAGTADALLALAAHDRLRDETSAENKPKEAARPRARV